MAVKKKLQMKKKVKSTIIVEIHLPFFWNPGGSVFPEV